MALPVFRVIVRGTTESGTRVRRCENLPAADMGAAYALHGAIAQALVERHGLADPTYNLYPPVGELCRLGAGTHGNGLSKGYALVGGLVTKVGVAQAAVLHAASVSGAADKAAAKAAAKAARKAAKPSGKADARKAAAGEAAMVADQAAQTEARIAAHVETAAAEAAEYGGADNV